MEFEQVVEFPLRKFALKIYTSTLDVNIQFIQVYIESLNWNHEVFDRGDLVDLLRSLWFVRDWRSYS